VNPEDCPKLDECPKVMIVLDKDLLGFQYAEAIRTVCANCSEVKGANGFFVLSQANVRRVGDSMLGHDIL
jgi:hypothetical protein